MRPTRNSCKKGKILRTCNTEPLCFPNSAFTLIELLIVVAIIAILAAIAVPNFLEAQVRAKVSRVNSDLRTLGIALEAYMVDHNTYPQPCAYPLIPLDPFRMIAYHALSTPVAYVTTGILIDPFAFHRAIGEGYGASRYYEMAFSTPGRRAGDLDNQLRSGVWTSRDMYMIHSFGPDKVDDTSLGDFGYLNPAGQPTATARIYDPTNGTVSVGDIHRVQAPAVFVRFYTVQGTR
ncbi:prepilin-type N-terminal cleavage/methylation domain-containing protein [Candidatus Sumerlaeota bacterium]|nr:prepilin-type N-terminal cleavage/methylation domain-containing protein [Candidatus Sumerlaeota bacterium]